MSPLKWKPPAKRAFDGLAGSPLASVQDLESPIEHGQGPDQGIEEDLENASGHAGSTRQDDPKQRPTTESVVPASPAGKPPTQQDLERTMQELLEISGKSNQHTESLRIRIEQNPEGGFFLYCNVDGCLECCRTDDPTALRFICCIHRAERKFGARVHFQPYQFCNLLKRNTRPGLRFEIGDFLLPDVLFPVSTLNPNLPPAASLEQRLDPSEFLRNGAPTYTQNCLSEYDKQIPSWVFDDGAVSCLLVGKYPKLPTQWSALQKAVRWNYVIRLYFRLNWSAGDVAQFINTDTDTIENLVRAIRKAGERLHTVDGKWQYERPVRKIRSIRIKSESTRCGDAGEKDVEVA